MMNSYDVLLIDRINKKFDELDTYEQGGVTHLKIALDEMFTFNSTIITFLLGFFEASCQKWHCQVPNEDVHAAVEQITDYCHC